MRAGGPDRIVLDGSIALAWAFEDETSPYADAVQDALADGAQGIVPPLWFWEIGNVLTFGERAGRIDEAGEIAFFANLTLLPIDTARGRTVSNVPVVMQVARRYRLTVYDAEYLTLAMEEGCRLATLDRELIAAAPVAGVELFIG